MYKRQTNQSPEGRQSNRRTEFLIIDKDGKYQRTPCVTYTTSPKNQWTRKTAVTPVSPKATPTK